MVCQKNKIKKLSCALEKTAPDETNHPVCKVPFILCLF